MRVGISHQETGLSAPMDDTVIDGGGAAHGEDSIDDGDSTSGAVPTENFGRYGLLSLLGAGGMGQGLFNLADRVGGFGGRLRVDSAPGRGTSISGRIPLDDV